MASDEAPRKGDHTERLERRPVPEKGTFFLESVFKVERKIVCLDLFVGDSLLLVIEASDL